jgi:protein-S-isoprenylcysteine O-methyltransferase Ste14
MKAKPGTRYCVGGAAAVVGGGVALFWSAGRIAWWPAWACLAGMAAWVAGMYLVVLRRNPALLAERLAPARGSKRWDVAILSMLNLTDLARYVVAGLDQRYGWTGGFPLAVQATALVVYLLGLALFVWAAASNSYFTKVVRIQSERGHAVATQGPYRYVRHPSYFAGILWGAAASVLLGSWWALVGSGVSAGLLIVRTALEDRTLRTELPGYADYARTVRHRLVPGIW